MRKRSMLLRLADDDSQQRLLFDSINGVLGLSFRKLRTAYDGYSFRARRVSDNAETDVGFDANNIASLLAPISVGGNLGDWIGASSATVKTWYDQTGNGNHATQSTAARQPAYNGNIQNGRPGAIFTMHDLIVQDSLSIKLLEGMALYTYFEPTAENNGIFFSKRDGVSAFPNDLGYQISIITSGAGGFGMQYCATNSSCTYSNSDIFVGQKYVVAVLIDGFSGRVFINDERYQLGFSGFLPVDSASPSDLHIGSYLDGSSFINDKVGEIIVWPTVADLAPITNLLNYWGI